MRERTPSADDTLARAPQTTPPLPPTPSSETASAKVIVDPGSVGVTVAPEASVNSNKNSKMVASSHSLEELGVTHPASASGDRGALDTNRTAQTALDKRSRLSNVINNLRKKVPETQTQPQIQQQQQQQQQQPKVENDGRNSVERNLENLEKYVMTVLNGVINEEAEKVDENNHDDSCCSSETRKNRVAASANETDTISSTDIAEASYPANEGTKIEDEKWRSVVTASCTEGAKGAEKNADEALEGAKNVVEDLLRVHRVSETHEPEERPPDPGKAIVLEDIDPRCSPDDTRSPGDHQIPEEPNLLSKNPNKLMDVCRELMNDLLNDIHQLIEGKSRDTETTETRFTGSSPTSLHCSLPLDKVAPILRTCSSETPTSGSSGSPQRSPSRPSPPTVRHLCLYCDRKFLSISLRQRHAERVHQAGGGSRRSERNSRRTVQNCQYCFERTNNDISEGSDQPETTFEALDNLDSLFRHMAKNHSDRYHACVQCSTRYTTRESLASHTMDVHGYGGQQEMVGKESPKDRSSPVLIREQQGDEETPKKDSFANPGSPEFDSTFYSSVSCNIRENLLHHLDGKLQANQERTPAPNPTTTENKPQQNFYETNASQIQFPIDISLTAATPVYTNSKEYSNDGNENSSEYAQRPGKTRSHPRRVSFEKYNFPRKYDGKEPWSCSIKDLSKFDISTQLTLRKKQQLTKALMNTTLNRLCAQNGTNEQMNSGGTNVRQPGTAGLTDIEVETSNGQGNHHGHLHDAPGTASVPSEDSSPNSPRCSDLNIPEGASKNTIFTTEFASFIRLKSRWDEVVNTDCNNHHQVVYAELTGEWSRPRIYVCGACADRHVTLKEMEEHKACAHPNVWCSHFEFSGDQRDLYKHLFLPGKGPPTAKAKAAISPDKICTKCSRNCNTLAELHRHMLECGGDQTWLLGLFGNGKKKCKWRPFGSRSRRRRQRGMKRNIQNSQTPRANTPKEKPTNGPRVRPSDRESIQKMLANLPPKRASRKVLREENLARSRAAAAAAAAAAATQTVQTRSRPRISTDVSSSAVQSRNKAVLKNKLLKNAKSFQRNRSRIDNITAAIESVVKRRIKQSNTPNDAKSEEKKNDVLTIKRTTRNITAKNLLTVLSKKKNVKTKDSTISNIEHPKTRGRSFAKNKVSNRSRVKARSNLPSRTTLSKGNSGKAGNSSSKNDPNPQPSGEKNSKENGKEPEEDGEEKSATTNAGKTKKKKLVDPVASLNASIKAKQQLRTNDGKFARNPNGREDRASRVLPDRYPRRRHDNVNGFVPKSRIKATKEFSRNQINAKTGKRISRTPSEGEKMPTLEPAVSVKKSESSTADADSLDKIARGNELPVLSPAGINAKRRNSRNSTDAQKKNISVDQLDLDDVLEKSVIDVAELKNKFKRENALRMKSEANKKRNRGSARGKRISLGVAPPTPAASSASSSASSSSSSSASPSSFSTPITRVREKSKGQKISPRRKNANDNDENRRSTSNEKPIEPEHKEDLMTRLGLKGDDQKPRRSTRTASLSKDRGDEAYSSQEEICTAKKLTEDAETLRAVGGVRKSPRNAAKAIPQASKSKDTITSEKLNEDDSQANNESEIQDLQVRSDPEEDLEEEPEDDPEETQSDLPKRGRALGKRRGRIKAVEPEDEETSDSVANLSLEHLQHESSNSNVDSGKENSSETPVTIPKPRAVRPRKTKSGRPSRDRTAKRTLGSVIGILTEGVNIPVEIQQSVVLTVQTTSVGSEIANSESEGRPEDQQQSQEIIEEKSISQNENEDGNNTGAITRLETLCGSQSEQNDQSKADPDPPKVCNSSSNEIQGVGNETVPSRTSTACELPVIEKSSEVPAAGNSNSVNTQAQNVMEPSNDIIMDLSRRKPKGKGSFLEKIVSKIAKQKDVLLGEGDVGSLLDNAAEELTNILDEVAPNLIESTENLTVSNNETQNQNVTKAEENGTEVSKSSESGCVEPTVQVGPTLEGNQLITISASENSCAPIIPREDEEEVEVKISEDSNTSKKRAFETNSPKKNKRQSLDSEAIPEPEDLFAEELCLADIMKLIQKPKEASRNTGKDGDTARPGKRKPAVENDQEILRKEIGEEESDCQNTPKNPEDGESKRPKRRSAKKKPLVEEHLTPIDDVPASAEKGNKSEESSPKKMNKRKTVVDEDSETPDPETEQSTRSNSAGSSSAKRRSVLSGEKSLEDAPLSILSKFVCGQSSKASTQGEETLQEPQRRSSKRKSSLAIDNADKFVDNNSLTNSEIKKYEDSASQAKNIKRFADEDVSSEDVSPGNQKIVDTPESEKRKSITKKRKSVTGAAEDEESFGREDESTLEEELIQEEPKKLKTSTVGEDSGAVTKRRSSRRTNSLIDVNLDLDLDESRNSLKTEGGIHEAGAKIESSEVVQRLRTLRRRNSKRKSLAEDHLELSEDEEEAIVEPFKIPEITEVIHQSKTRRSSKKSLTLPENSTDRIDSVSEESTSSGAPIVADISKIGNEKAEYPGKSLINEHLDLSDEDNENQLAENPEQKIVEPKESMEETIPVSEISTEDDMQQETPKKRASGNFAVGHTKTGEILIVEKKKKLTKEAARFFCEVCATSFTRKSSLKKHNSSQSHLMQVAKSEKEEEPQATDVAKTEGEEVEGEEKRNRDRWASEESLEDPLNETKENLSQDVDQSTLKSEANRAAKNPLTAQISEEEALEDELLDEEICKITENMTHDDFVLTDHISPELPVVSSSSSTGKNKVGKKLQTIKTAKEIESPKTKKRNLAEEHLDLDSPSPQENRNTHEDPALDDKESSTSLETESLAISELSEAVEVSVSTSDVCLPEVNDKISSKSSLELVSPDSLLKIDDISVPKHSEIVTSCTVSVPVTIKRDVLILSDESSSDRPLAEVLLKTSIPRSRNSRSIDDPEEKSRSVIEEQLSKELTPSTLDFRNIVQKLNSPNNDNDDDGKEENDAEFESDDSSMETGMSVSIRKLLDDPEMSEDSHGNKSVDHGKEKIPSIEVKDKEEAELEVDLRGNESSRSKRGRKKTQRESVEKHARKSRSAKPRRRQKLAECRMPETDSSEEDNSDVDATSESRNKNKIVKSVFGRVFGGEKIEKAEKIQDKVKEVLEDWDSRSEDDIRGRSTPLSSSAASASPGSKRNSRSKRRKNRSKTKTRENEPVIIESRSRRSKKRAEERISKAFEEESTSVLKEISFSEDEQDQDNDFPIVKDNAAIPEPNDHSKGDDVAKIDDDGWAIFSGEIAKHENAKSNTKEPTNVAISNDTVPNEAKNSDIRVPLSTWPSMLPSSPSPSSPGQSSIARSSVRNRSPTPDRNSQSSGASDSEDDGPRGRLSPVFVRNTPDSSMDSLNSSEETPAVFLPDNDKKLASVVSSPMTKCVDEDPRVVTIAPNDAVEDNALDVPRPVITQNVTVPLKPRQAKVLNFDEELFVECCSRLRTTTENELRGAKKIEIDHSDGYHKKDAGDSVGFRSIRDRWRDVESQNSLGSLLESVNQLLGEEMYANNEKDYSKHANRDARSENSSRSGSPDLLAPRPPDNLGYEDSLDVAFEHNNKLRDKIQQRMRASENLIASSFPCETPPASRNSYGEHNSRGILTVPNISMDESRNTPIAKVAMTFDEQHSMGKNFSLESAGFKHNMTSTLGGLLDKLALSNLLHSTTKHDHNGSTPMKVLAELACARAPTTTPSDLNPDIISVVQSKPKDFTARKIRNPIKELFERKKELNDRNQPEKTRAVAVAVAALKELNVQRQRKTTKKSKRRIQEFPLVRKSPYGGMAERKKRRDLSSEKKDMDGIRNDKVKDVYDFDDEESQAEAPLPSVVSFRSKIMSGEPDLASLASKTIVETLENGKEADVLGRRLESMIDRKFKEVEKFTPKTKGALKAFQNERSNSKEITEAGSELDKAKEQKDEVQETTVGPMDDFVQRNKQQQHHKRSSDTAKRSKSKKRSKTSKKKSRVAAWYENDSSDEFRTAAKTEDIGVGISKSQRTCSKGKQNLFAELSSTSSESEIENDERLDYVAERETPKKGEFSDERFLEQRIEVHVEPEPQKKTRNYSETKKSESEMSDHPLIIDERRESDEDSSARNNYEPSFEMDDLYREDSSDDADTECPGDDGGEKKDEENTEGVLPKTKFLKDDELIPLEEALELLDQTETLGEMNKNEKEFLKEVEDEEEARPSKEEELQDRTESPLEKNREENEVFELPEKLSSNEKPAKASDNLPLHVFLSRKVQESKKRKQHLRKLQEEQDRILLELQPARRQRKCAIGKQGLLAEISSSDEDSYDGGKGKFQDKERSSSPDKPRRQKRESREKRKERYIEKKHEQIIAKEQKAIEEEILRELGKTVPQDTSEKSLEPIFDTEENKGEEKSTPKKAKKQKPKKTITPGFEADLSSKLGPDSESENNIEKTFDSPSKQKKQLKSDQKSPKKSSNNRAKKHSECNGKESKDGKERRSSGMKRDSTDEELRTTKSWNKVEEGVGVAIGRRKRAAANQLYYWSSSSDEEDELVEEPLPNVEEEDDRQEQHGWIVGDSHKRMITMLAMEKQLKEKRRRSEDEFEPNKVKNKKHRNSTS